MKLIIFASFLSIISCSNKQNFDSIEWKGWVESENNQGLRWKMSKDLIDNYNLKSMTEKDILNLLGEPEDKFKDKFIYFLGYTGNGINTGTLEITFKNKIVYNIKLYEG